jgi:hypothetical protein
MSGDSRKGSNVVSMHAARVRKNAAHGASGAGAAMDCDADFPSETHYKWLKEKGFDGRQAEQDLWESHAYDYGWRRIILRTRDDNSPIDPDRRWFDEKLAALAEIFYARKFKRQEAPRRKTYCWEPGYAARYEEPWFLALKIEDQLHFKEQDLARAEAHRLCTSPEDHEAFATLCREQAQSNLSSSRKPISAAETAARKADAALETTNGTDDDRMDSLTEA